MMYEAIVTKAFFDTENKGKLREIGETIKLDSALRVRKLIGMGLVRLFKIVHSSKTKKSGKKIMIYVTWMYKIGGVETWCYNLAKAFKNEDITFILGHSCDFEQIMRLAKYHNIVFDHAQAKYECDVFMIAFYAGAKDILNRVKCDKYYQFIHGDLEWLTKHERGWGNFKWEGKERMNAFVAVSETARRGLKSAYGEDSIVVQNPLAKPDEKPTVFITLSRATPEKGINRIIEMARKFDEEGREFIWLLCSTLNQGNYRDKIDGIPRIIVVPPSIHATNLIRSADYLVQLSDSESYCYSIHEALQLGVPVIATEFDEAKKVIKDGKNGYLLKFDLSNLDTAKIFDSKPKFTPHPEPIDSNWQKMLKGEI